MADTFFRLTRLGAAGVLTAAWTSVAGSQASSRQTLPRYEDTCPAQWSDEIAGVESVLKCREEFRQKFKATLALPGKTGHIRQFQLDPVQLAAREDPQTLARRPLRVVVINLNPYLYQYKITIKRSTVSETAPLDFFKAILPGPPSITLPPSGATSTTYTVQSMRMFSGDSLADPACSEPDRTRLTALLNQEKALDAVSQTVAQTIDWLTALDAKRVAIEAIIRNPRSQMSILQDSAIVMIDVLKDLANGLDPTAAAIDFFQQQLAQLTDPVPPPPRGCASLGRQLERIRDSLNVRGRRFAVTRKEIGSNDAREARRTALATERQSVGTPLLVAENFYFVTVITARTGEIDSVIVERRPVDAKPTDGYTTAFASAAHIGLPRLFSLAGALAYINGPVHTYSTVKRYSGAAVPADSVETIIAEQAHESRRISPMLTIGGTVLPIDQWLPNNLLSGIGAQLGATVVKDPSVSLEYFLGGSVHLFDNRAYVAYGAFAQKEQNLVAGFTVGGRLPTAQGTPPVVTNTRWRRAWLFGFRFY